MSGRDQSESLVAISRCAQVMEAAMSSRADLDNDLERLIADTRALADENDRLRMINAEMVAALESALPILQEGLPAVVNVDLAKEAMAKVQAALGKAESDPELLAPRRHM
jgi:hypothetical protein